MVGSDNSVVSRLQSLGVLDIQKTQRSKDLANRASFFGGQQHDHHSVGWNGVSRQEGVGYMSERLRTAGFVPINDVDGGHPSWLRKPDCTIPIGRQIVQAFTGMLLSETPGLYVYGDDDTQGYLRALFKAARVWELLSQARNMAGKQGCAAILSGIHENSPYTELLDPTNLWVAEWDEGFTGWRPKTVVEQLKVSKEVLDEKTGKLSTKDFWQCRAWTTEHTYLYEDLPVDAEEELKFRVKQKVAHRAGRCPITWIQNQLDMKNPYSEPDYEAVYEQMDQLDRLESQVHKATVANTDPSLLLKNNRTGRRGQKARGIKRGGVVEVAVEGDARYLEMSGSGIKVSQEQVDREIAVIRDTAQCVIVTMSEGTKLQSSESLQLLYRPMEIRASHFRAALAGALEDICDVWVHFAEAYPIRVDKLGLLGDSKKTGPGILLPPRKCTDSGQGEADEPHKLGSGGVFSLAWPPAFKPTPAQISAISAGLSTSTAAKSFVSQKSATRVLAGYLGLDPEEEVRRLDEEAEEAEALFEDELAAGLKRFEEEPSEDDTGGSADGDAWAGENPDELPAGNPGKPRNAAEVTRPAAKAKRGKRGPAKEE